MRRLVLLITAACCGLSLSVSNRPEIVLAQTPPSRTDTIYFMGATRGNNYNGTGVLSWCVSQSWHPGYQLPDGTRDPYNSALDEVAQVKAAPPGQPGSWSDPVFYDSCHSEAADPTGKVDLTTYGSTDQSTCSSPCVSLVVIANSKSYPDGCDYIEAALWDAWDPVHKEGNRRGKQIMMHAQAPNNSGAPYSLPSIQVTTTGLYASNEIGTITNDTDCQGGFRGYHVHHTFVPPVTQNCSWAKNTPGGFVFQATDRKKGPQNTADWVHMLSHQPGIFCDDVGPKSADNLLDPATGALDGDGNGAGTRALATGGPGYTITTSQTCFPGTSWCGTISVTQPLLQAARSYSLGTSPVDYFMARQQRFPRSGDNTAYYWYNRGGYYFYLVWQGDTTYPWGWLGPDSCGGAWTDYGQPILGTWYYGSVGIGCVQNWMNPGAANLSAAGVANAWAQFRGVGGENPSAPPSQEDANTWAQTQIDSGHWWDVVKPALDAVIRAARDQRDMATLGITGNPSFDGDPGEIGYAGAGVPDGMTRVASRITGPSSSNWAWGEMNRDWIRSTRLRRDLIGEGFEMVPD